MLYGAFTEAQLWTLKIRFEVWLMSQFASYFCDQTLTRTNWGRKGFISAYRLQSPSWREARQETKAGPGIKAETIEKCCLLACLACSLLQLRPTCPYMTPSTLGWVPYINQQARKGLKIYQRVSPISEILSFQVCLSVYQVGKTTIFGVSTNHLCHLRTIDLN